MSLLYFPKKAIAQAVANFVSNSVVALLRGEGSNNQTNNVFLDSSIQNHTMTRNGNMIQGSFSPFCRQDGDWGVKLNGTTDSMISPDGGFLESGVDFTLEFWVRHDAMNSLAADYLTFKNSNSDFIMGVYWYSSAVPAGGNTGSATPCLCFYNGFGGAASAQIAYPITPTLNRWYHVAISKDSSSVKMFLDGNKVGETTFVSTQSSSTVYIGGVNVANRNVNGTMTNIRLVKDSAIYQTNFTPSTSPLYAISGTSLLTAQSNRIKDNSSSNRTITVTGTPKVSLDTPFQHVEYSSATMGGSGYFDKNGDFLTSPGDTSDLDLTSGDFTIECWMWAESAATYQSLISKRSTNVSDFELMLTPSGKVTFFTTSVRDTATATIPVFQWTHIACVRSAGTNRIYQNGIQVFTSTDSVTYNSSFPLNVGRSSSTSTNYFGGYLTDIQITKGVARYSGSFTPPTEPGVSNANTSLLLNFNNAGIVDSTSRATLDTVGAKISSAARKAGASSIYFDGASYLLMPYRTDHEFGSSDMTIEFWYNSTQSPTSGTYPCFITKNWGASPYTGGWSILSSNGNAGGGPMQVYLASYSTSTAMMTASVNTPRDGQWHHVAWTKSGNVHRLFLDGVQVATQTTTATFAVAAKDISIGDDITFGGATSRKYVGYIDNVRLTKGTALYTATFTPPEDY